jgi:hypothetical protein
MDDAAAYMQVHATCSKMYKYTSITLFQDIMKLGMLFLPVAQSAIAAGAASNSPTLLSPWPA